MHLNKVDRKYGNYVQLMNESIMNQKQKIHFTWLLKNKNKIIGKALLSNILLER
jgi:hypothetical protein